MAELAKSRKNTHPKCLPLFFVGRAIPASLVRAARREINLQLGAAQSGVDKFKAKISEAHPAITDLARASMVPFLLDERNRAVTPKRSVGRFLTPLAHLHVLMAHLHVDHLEHRFLSAPLKKRRPR